MTLDLIELSPDKVSSAVRKAIRVARLDQDYANLFWLEYEMLDMGTDSVTNDLVNELYRAFDDQTAENINNTTHDRYVEGRGFFDIDDTGLRLKEERSYISLAVDQIELTIQHLRSIRSPVTDPAPRLSVVLETSISILIHKATRAD